MSYYSDHANDLFRFYQSVDPSLLHQNWPDLLSNQPGLACDIGAGSGRDAVWLASKGWKVIAVEPAEQLRTLGEAYTSSHAAQQGSITWLDEAGRFHPFNTNNIIEIARDCGLTLVRDNRGVPDISRSLVT
jgi:2-polyprenyl-3-methyl-5-hydroxy-6-metoxy-1,4-benzoquinol methylase